MGCVAAKNSSKDKPKGNFSPRDTSGPQPAASEASARPSPAPVKASQAPPPANKKNPPPRLELPRHSMPKKDPKTFKSPHIAITTAYEEKDIIRLEMTPRGTIKKSVHFNCPVCFSYYNVILSSQCCKNYLCHLCAKDLLERDEKGGKGIACPSCQHEPLLLADVDLEASVKVYTDTFAITGKGKAGEQMVEEDGLEVKDSPRRMDDPDNRF